MDFSPPNYDTKRNNRTCGKSGRVVFMYKTELIPNKIYTNNYFNIITNNKTFAIGLELSSKIILTLATICCPNRKPDHNLFRAVTSLSDWHSTGGTDILDMTFIAPNLKSRDFHFSAVVSLGRDHLSIEILADKPHFFI